MKVDQLHLDDYSTIQAEQVSFGQLAIQQMLIDAEMEVGFIPYSEPEPGGTAIEELGEEHEPEMNNSLEPEQTVRQDLQSNTLDTAPPDKQPSFESSPVETIRLLIGEDVRTGELVYWEYGHLQLPNRHILITGTSGTGKTYFIQSLMYELTQHGTSCLVFDYTDGFTPQKLEPELVEVLGDRIIQLPIYHQPFPLNPFKRYPIEIAGEIHLQKPIDVAERIKSSFTKVFRLGDQQANAVYNAVKNGMAKYDTEMTMEIFGEELRQLTESLPYARTALSRIEPLIDRDPFDHTSSHDWSILERNPGSIVIIQLSGFVKGRTGCDYSTNTMGCLVL
ncbi:MAG: helicase HerA domain-containing protein [Limnochordia bacterium]